MPLYVSEVSGERRRTVPGSPLDRMLSTAGDWTLIDESATPVPAQRYSRIFDPTRSLYRADGATLRALRATLAKRDAQPVKILFAGDSLTAGFASTAPGWTDPVRQLGQAIWNQDIGLSGFLVPVGNTYWYQWEFGSWDTGETDFPWASGSESAVLTFTADWAGTIVEIVTSGESAPFAYAIDGGDPTTHTPSGAYGIERVIVDDLADTTHTITITADATGGSYIWAVGVYRPTGLVLVPGGLSGSMASAGYWALSNPYTGMINSLAAADADIAIIELGVNDIFNEVGPEAFGAALSARVQTCIDNEAIPVLVASHGCQHIAAPWADYLHVFYDVADAKSTPLLDLTDRFGHYADADSWHTLGMDVGDGTHLSDLGNRAKSRSLLDLLTA